MVRSGIITWNNYKKSSNSPFQRYTSSYDISKTADLNFARTLLEMASFTSKVTLDGSVRNEGIGVQRNADK